MNYRPEIDGLRALAVVPVILYHAGFSAFSGGYVGVDVFFVISGYLITTILADQIAAGRFSLLNFYERRARRILPVLFAVILVSLPFAWFWLMLRDLEGFAQSILAVITFTSNFYFLAQTGYFETAADLQPLLHTWSLAVEEQFYIFFPLLLMLIWRRSPAIILSVLLVASLLLAEWMLARSPSAAFFWLPTRAWELLIGALAALYLRRVHAPRLNGVICDLLSAVGLGLIVFAVLSYDESTRFPGIAALPPTIGTCLVVLFAGKGGAVHRLLSLRPLVWIGLISYGAYLWHQPVFALFQHRFGSAAFADLALPLIALSFVLAFGSYHLIEQPFRKGRSVRMLVWSMLGSAGLAIGLGAAIYVQADDHPQNVPSYQWAVAHADPTLLRYVERRDVFMACGAGEDAQGVQQCRFGAPGVEPSLVLWGDSLALALLSGLDEVASGAGRSGVAFAANGCPPVPGLANAAVATCTGDTHDQVLDRILGLDGITDVVITGNLEGAMNAGSVTIDGAPSSFDAVRDKLAAVTAQLTAQGIRVVMLEQGPVFGEDVSTYLLQNLRSGHAEPLGVSADAFRDVLRHVQGLADLPVTYVSTLPFFCTDTQCPSVGADGQIVMFDTNHVTRLYSAKLARFLFDQAGL